MAHGAPLRVPPGPGRGRGRVRRGGSAIQNDTRRAARPGPATPGVGSEARRRAITPQRHVRSSRPRAPIPIASLLQRYVRERGWQERLGREAVLEAWPSVVGPVIARHTAALRIRDGILHVAVESGPWASQLSFFTDTFLGRLRGAHLPALRGIAFHPGALPPRQAVTAPAGGGPQADLSRRAPRRERPSWIPDSAHGEVLHRVFAAADARQRRLGPPSPRE